MGNPILTNDTDLPKVRAERSCEAIMTSRALVIQRLDVKGLPGGEKHTIPYSMKFQGARDSDPFTVLLRQYPKILGKGFQCHHLYLKEIYPNK